MRFVIAVGAAMLVGCGGVAVTPHGPSPVGGSLSPEPMGGMPGGTVRPPATVGNARAINGGGTRTICRQQGTPRGFVATQYLSVASCPVLGDSSRVDNAKIVQDLRPLAAGTTVRMCGDQSIPRGWYVVSSPDNEEICGSNRTKPVQTREIRKGG